MVTAQFLGKIDRSSLLVQDDYIFVKVTMATLLCSPVFLNLHRKQEVTFQSELRASQTADLHCGALSISPAPTDS